MQDLEDLEFGSILFTRLRVNLLVDLSVIGSRSSLFQMASTFENKAVSEYVLEVLGLTPGQQSTLLATKLRPSCVDTVSAIAAGLKFVEQKPPTEKTAVNDCKFCVDDHDGYVYVLVSTPARAAGLWRFMIGVDNSGFHVCKVNSIVTRIGSAKSFDDIPVAIKSLAPEASVPFHLSSETVSLFVVHNLDLNVGAQSELIAAKGLVSDNPVKLVARVLKQNRGADYLPLCKLVYDSGNGSVYVKVVSEADANLMAGRSFEVAGQPISFYRVLSVSVRPQADDLYQRFSCRLIGR